MNSLMQCQIYDGKIRPYVVKHLLNKGFTKQNIQEMPITGAVNISRKVAQAKAALYKTAPVRSFSGCTDAQADQIESLYNEVMMDSKLLSSNRLFEIQGRQNHVMVIPKMGKLKMRVLKNHQINVIPFVEDPEVGEIFIISGYDEQTSELREKFSNNSNESIADEDDYKSELERYYVWSSSVHLKMDGKGKILSEDTVNPIAPFCPVIEVAVESKDFKYFLQEIGDTEESGDELSNFTVEYNTAVSMLHQCVEMGSFGQAILEAPADLQPIQIVVGPTKILRLITDPNMPNTKVDFRFANPSSDIASAQSFVLSLLAQFLSSQGLDPKSISGNADAGEAFTSGISRMLAMIKDLDGSKESEAIYSETEQKLFEIIKAWVNIAGKSTALDYDFKIPEQTTLSVEYSKPEQVLTEDEKLSMLERKYELGVISKVDMIALLENKSIDEAKTRLAEIEDVEMMAPKNKPVTTTETEEDSEDEIVSRD